MPSRADGRRAAEWLLRAAVLGGLALAFWRASRAADQGGSSIAASARTMDGAIDRAIATPATASLDLSIDGAVSRAQRDALIALRRAGTAVRWHGDPPSLAVQAVRNREPDGRARVSVVGITTAPAALADSAGLIDTMRATPSTTVDVGTLVGTVRASVGRYSAHAPVPPETPRRAVLVLGTAGWETRFVMAALGEAGWLVRARIPTAPGVDVRDSALLPLDTTRYDAVIALDSSADVFGAAIVRFVTQGGGLIATGSALSLAALRPVVPARAGERRPGRILLADDTVTPPDLPVRPLQDLRSDAISLERDPVGVTLAARRAGLGRIIAVGYDESWRWRMLGGVSGLAAHRAWWSRAVGSVAPERERPTSVPESDAAPRAALLDALGPPFTTNAAPARERTHPLPLALLAGIAMAVLAEIASRRFRGAK